MLDSLAISNFRRFKELKIPRLGRVNLFSGRNGIGKSCLLEAVNLLSKEGDHSVLLELITIRNESVALEMLSEGEYGGELVESPLRHLFRGYCLPLPNRDGISIGNINEPQKLKIYTLLYIRGVGKHGEPALVPVVGGDVGKLFVVTEMNGEILRVPVFEEPRPFVRSIKTKFQIQSVSSHGLQDAHVALLWDRISLTPLEREVVGALNIIQPAISGMAFISVAEGHRERLPVVRIEGMNQRVPLKSLGDGVVRLLHIILALVNAENGVFLLDEAENGLHWSVQGKLWEIVFYLATRLNIQVFATTHSKDCIEGFYSAWDEKPQEGAFFRMDACAELGAKCIPYSLRNLGNALDSRVEMR